MPKTTIARCTEHRAIAGWVCSGCEKVLCPDCAATRRVASVDLTTCIHCGASADPLLKPKAGASLLSQLGVSAGYPFHIEGLTVWAALSVATALSAYLPLGRFIALSFAVATAFAITRATLRGSSMIEVPFSDFFSDIVMPLVRFVVAMLPAWGPEVFLEGRMSPGLAVVVGIAGLLWAPFSYIGAATSASMISVLNPIVILGVMARVGRDAAVYVATAFALFLTAGLLAGLGLAALQIPFVGRIIACALLVWPLLVFARVAGFVVMRHPEPFGLLADDAYEPVLGTTAPRGTLRAAPEEAKVNGRSHAPIELDDTAALEAQRLAALRESLAAKDIVRLKALATPLPAGATLVEYLSGGRLLAAHHQDEAASVLLERAAGCDGDPAHQSEARVIWARFLGERAGQPQLAVEWFNHVVTVFPGTQAAAFATRWLESHPQRTAPPA